ncbi:MAG: DUF928 domain-containing protein [Candidatus Tectomicrobia bacterium]|nr:DUF928 domain-containing protein [Candidatus Tectomicrobia bacterium]
MIEVPEELECEVKHMTTCKRRTWILIASLIGVVLVSAIACSPTPKLEPGRPQSAIQFDPRIAEVTRHARIPTCGGRKIQRAPEAKIVVLAPYKLSLTHRGHPSLFWYYGLNVACPVELIIAEQEGPTVLSPRQLPRPNFGINRIDLANSPYHMNVSLEPDIVYQWSIRVLVDFETRPSAYPISYGFIKRETPLDVIQQIEQQPDHKKLQLYAKHGFWYDALSVVSDLRKAQPRNLKFKQFHASLLTQEILPDYVIQVIKY